MIYSQSLLNIPGCYGDLDIYHTQLSVAQFLVSAFLSKMFDVGDLLVLTFGNCVLKAEWLSGPWTFFNIFSQNPKNMTFYVFLSCCTRFLEHCCKRHVSLSVDRFHRLALIIYESANFLYTKRLISLQIWICHTKWLPTSKMSTTIASEQLHQ